MNDDPGREALRMLVQRSWDEGFAAGLKKRAVVSFSLGIVIGSIAMLSLLIGVAFAQTIPPAASKYKHDLTLIARSVWGMDAPISSLIAQVQQESAFKEDAVSWAGARGLTQMMPRTAAGLAKEYPELQPVNEFSATWALRAQSLLMRDLYLASAPAVNKCHQYAFALASYNQGPRWTRLQRERSSTPGRYFGETERVNPGKRQSAFEETFWYARRILLVLEPRYSAAGWGPSLCGDTVGIGK